MPTEIKVLCLPDENMGAAIRTLFCNESAASNPADRNPLLETKFNEFLQRIAQSAFDEGRAFERKTGKTLG